MKEQKEIWEIVRILKDNLPKRCMFFLEEINIENVVSYKKQLLLLQEWLQDNFFADIFFVSEEKLEYLANLCKDEIKICDFYLSYPALTRQPNFNMWVTIEEKDRDIEKYRREGKLREGTAIIKTNGKIKAVIEVKDNITTTKISLSLQNDNKFLSFYNKIKLISEKNLRNKKSIEDEIERLKKIAEEEINKHSLPHPSYEKKEWEIYKNLMRCE